jgi:hypothetical protein
MVLVAAAEKPRDAVHGYVGEGSDPSRNGDGSEFRLWTLDFGAGGRFAAGYVGLDRSRVGLGKA